MAKLIEQENNTINLIGVGTEIKGDIESNGDIRIDGSLKGNIHTKGKVVIGNTGLIKGEVFCKNSDVEGKIDGKINVLELLSLKATSSIVGDISARRLAIEPGAKFTGNCNMSNEPISKDAGPPLRKTQKNLNNFTHYSGMGIQMLVIILAGTFGGIKLDEMSQTKFPVFTVVLSFLSVIIAMYLMLKDFLGKNSMETHLNRFIRTNLILTIILALTGGILFFTLLSAFYFPFIPLLLLFALVINFILYFVVTRKKVPDTLLLGMVVKSFAIKFFSYLAIVIIFLILEKTRVIRITFVAVLFILYFSFTWLEIQSLLKFLKSGENN